MSIEVSFSAGISFADACREAQELMRLLPVVRSVTFTANLIKCEVFPDTDPEDFEVMVNAAQQKGFKYVIGTMII